MPTLDENWGLGGSYLLDPKTGKRKLIERTAPALTASDSDPEVITDGTAVSQTPDPGEG